MQLKVFQVRQALRDVRGGGASLVLDPGVWKIRSESKTAIRVMLRIEAFKQNKKPMWAVRQRGDRIRLKLNRWNRG